MLEPTVTGGGIDNTTPASFGELNSETLFQPNGNFIVISAAGNPNKASSIMEQRFNERAVQDTTFGSTKFTFGGERRSAPNGIAFLANGQIVVGGLVNNASPIFDGLARLNANGPLDTTFGNGGTVTTESAVTGVLVQANGRLLRSKP